MLLDCTLGIITAIKRTYQRQYSVFRFELLKLDRNVPQYNIFNVDAKDLDSFVADKLFFRNAVRLTFKLPIFYGLQKILIYS